MACSGAAVVAVAGVAYGAVRNHGKTSRERAEEARRANQKSRDCQELLELTEQELAGMYASYRGQRRALVGLRKTIKSKENEIRSICSGALGSNVHQRELHSESLYAEFAHRDAQMRELSRRLVAKQSKVDSLTHEKAKKCAEVERLVVDLAGKDRDVSRLTQESQEKGAQIYRLTIESAEKSGTLRRRDIQVRALTAELSEKELVHSREEAGTGRTSHGTQNTARTRDPVRDLVHTLSGEIANDQVDARPTRGDNVATDSEDLRKELVRCRESAAARLAAKDNEIASVRRQANEEKDAMIVELSELKNRCSRLDRAFYESSDVFQKECNLREQQHTRKREELQEREARLTGDVTKLRGRLNKERATGKALAQTYASMKAEKTQLIASLTQATDNIVAAESRATQADSRVTAVEGRIHELDTRASKANSALAAKAAEVDFLIRDLVAAREALTAAGGRVSDLEVQVAGLTEACEDMFIVTGRATAREGALVMELTDALKRCTAFERERGQYLPVFQSQLFAREARAKEEREKVYDSLQIESAQLTASLLQATDKTAAAEYRATQSNNCITGIDARSEERIARMEARFRGLTAPAPMATDDVARQTAEVESLTRYLAEAEATAAVDSGDRVSAPVVQIGDAYGKYSVPKKLAYLGEELDETQSDKERWSCGPPFGGWSSTYRRPSPHIFHCEVPGTSHLELHQPALELPREIPLGNPANRMVMWRPTDTDLEEKQEVKEDRGRQWCEDGSGAGLDEFEADNETGGGSKWITGTRGTRRDGSGGAQVDWQTAVSLNFLEVEEGEQKSDARDRENVLRQEQATVEAVANSAQEAGRSIVHAHTGAIMETRDSKGVYTTVMLVSEADEMMLLQKGTRQGAIMVLQGDFGVTMGYNRPNHTVSIKGATVEVQRAVVARLRSALVHCGPVYQDPGYSLLVTTNMSPPASADLNDATFAWWRGKVHTHCNNHACVGDLVGPGDKRVGRPRPRQLGLVQEWDLFVWGPSWAAQALVAVTPDHVRHAAIEKDAYELLRPSKTNSDESTVRQAGAEREGRAEYKREGAEVRMPRPALIAVASPQRLEEAVDQAVADVAAAAEGAGMESTGSSGESSKARIKAWVNLVAGKVVISGQHPREMMHVCQSIEASFEAWNSLEVKTTISNRAGRDFRFHPAKLSDISQAVGVPLVVYIDGGLCGVTRRTEVRGRAQTEEIAMMARIKLVQMKEFGGALWYKELDNMRDRVNGKRLDDRKCKGHRGTTSERYGTTDVSCQDHLGGRRGSGVESLSTKSRLHQQLFHGVGDREQPCASHGTIGEDYAMSGGGFGGGGYRGDTGNNYPLSFTPVPTAVPVAHYPVTDMPLMTYQYEQLLRAMTNPQQHHHHYAGVEGHRAGRVLYHYEADDDHEPLGPFEHGQYAIGSMNRTYPPAFTSNQGGEAMHEVGFGPPPAHANPMLYHQNVTPTASAAFFAGGTFGGEPLEGRGAQYLHR